LQHFFRNLNLESLPSHTRFNHALHLFTLCYYILDQLHELCCNYTSKLGKFGTFSVLSIDC